MITEDDVMSLINLKSWIKQEIERTDKGRYVSHPGGGMARSLGAADHDMEILRRVLIKIDSYIDLADNQ